MKDLRVTMGAIFIGLAAIAIAIAVFKPSSIDGFVGCNGECGPAARRPFAGLPYATCDDPYRCINGYCKGDVPPSLADTNLPIRPSRYTVDVPVSA